MMKIQNFLWLILLALCGNALLAQPIKPSAVISLVESARAQIGKTLYYDSQYSKLAYPMGDVPLERGVCTDVVIRAFRGSALQLDLQQAVHEDIRKHFASYPKKWGLKKPDANIDHRRVPNLMVYFHRKGKALAISQNAKDYQPGDIVTWNLPGNLPHIGIVSDKRGFFSKRPLVIHNIGAGTQEEDRLFSYPITGHFKAI